VPQEFSEKEFYLEEFHGRTLGIALPARGLDPVPQLADVLRELAANATRVVLLSPDRVLLEKLLGEAPLEPEDAWIEARVWRQARARGFAGLAVPGARPLAEVARTLALRLGFAKLVWIDAHGRFLAPDGRRIAFVDLDELRAGRLAGQRMHLVARIRAMLEAGLPSVNVCTLDGLADDLFTYAGTGTLFTRERYAVVRRLALDEFDAAYDLLRRGVEEGFLAPRPPEDIDSILANALGVFVEGHHLAGIGALLPHPAERAAEIASLYALTRFQGEGIGRHIVAHALEAARAQRLAYLFACTTSERVVRFFEREGFREVPLDQVPAEKWEGYDEARRERVRCLRRDLD
jgi:amino-acid N-acetyltransferase